MIEDWPVVVEPRGRKAGVLCSARPIVKLVEVLQPAEPPDSVCVCVCVCV